MHNRAAQGFSVVPCIAPRSVAVSTLPCYRLRAVRLRPGLGHRCPHCYSGSTIRLCQHSQRENRMSLRLADPLTSHPFKPVSQSGHLGGPRRFRGRRQPYAVPCKSRSAGGVVTSAERLSGASLAAGPTPHRLRALPKAQIKPSVNTAQTRILEPKIRWPILGCQPVITVYQKTPDLRAMRRGVFP